MPALRCSSALAAVGLLAAVPRLPAQTAEYDLFIIEPWDEQYDLASSSVVGLNELGEVTGCGTPLSGGCSFLWTRETGKTPIESSGPINDAGVIAAFGRVIFPDGSSIPFDGLGTPRDLNERLLVAGAIGSANCLKHNDTEGAVWDEARGTIRLEQDRGITHADEARAVNERGEVVGVLSRTGECGDFKAFYYDVDADDLIDLHTELVGTDLALTETFDINDAGIVLGLGPDDRGSVSPFLWERDRGFRFLPAIPGGTPLYTTGNSVNNLGQVVGEGLVEGDGWHAFIWDEARGIRDLNDLVDRPADFTIDGARAINDAGWIIGSGHDGNWSPTRAVVLVPADFDDRLTLEVSRLDVGARATFTVRDATPGAMQHVVYGTSGPGETPVPGLGVTLDVDRPALLESGPADADGTFSTTRTVPAAAGDRTIWFQAAESGRVSSVVVRYVDG